MEDKFVWEQPSDEEPEIYTETKSKSRQSPWEFASAGESAADEHERRSTTSIDDKISRVRQLTGGMRVLSDDDDEESEEEEFELEVEEMDDDDDEEEEEEEVENVKKGRKVRQVAVENEESLNPEVEKDVKKGNNVKKGKNAKHGIGVVSDSKAFFDTSEGTSFHKNSFMELNLSRPLLRACKELKYDKPTPIQAACIPHGLAGRDICGSAITGSGKTAAFSLPVLERLLFRPKERQHAIRVLILTPTRELAAQVHSMIEKLAQFTDIRCCLIVGGLPLKAQEIALRSMPDIVVATPGRMVDHLRNSKSVGLEDLAVLILDEADRLLELGFIDEINHLVNACPKRRQTMLFSATMTEEIEKLIKLSLTKPLRVQADPSAMRPALLIEEVIRIRRSREVNQEAVLLSLCTKTFTADVIIFSATKQAAHRLKILFGLAGLKAAELHGNLTQSQRLDALEIFKKHEVDFLIATDVLARGIDITGVQTVINFSCPRSLTSYLHRVGRTARAGREGHAVTFVTDNDRSILKSIAKRAGSTIKSRTVAEQSVEEWCQLIDQMEDQVREILEEESVETALRKAEMEATKAENMIAHKDEISARPKRTWFATETEKRVIAKAAKEKDPSLSKEVLSAEQFEDLKMKEKRKREREKHLPRKKRRRLEASREMLEEDEPDESEGNEKKGKTGKLLVDVGYKKAKAVKAISKAQNAGKFVKKADAKSEHKSHRTQSKTEEMKELFQGDMGDRKQTKSGLGKKKSRNSFKSKSRYKRK